MFPFNPAARLLYSTIYANGKFASSPLEKTPLIQDFVNIFYFLITF